MAKRCNKGFRRCSSTKTCVYLQKNLDYLQQKDVE